MSEFLAIIEDAISLGELLIPYWSFIAVTIVLAYLGQWIKKYVWNEENASKPGFWGCIARYGRVSYAIHPLILGWSMGFISNLSVPDWVGTSGRHWYFALAGIVSAYLYSVVRTYVKRAYEYDLKLPFVR